MKYVVDGIVYTTENGIDYLVTSYEKGVENAKIQLQLNGGFLRGVVEAAFRGCETLKTVEFVGDPHAFEMVVGDFEIGDAAFAECTALVTVEFPDCAQSVGYGAFRGCTALKSVEMPTCYVYPYAFFECEALTTVSAVNNVSEGVFSHCKSLTSLPITDRVEEIGESAFAHCNSLTDITIPKSVKSIVSLAFRNCHGLKTVTFEDTEGWYCQSRYKDGEFALDVTDPAKNARELAGMDFDDGIISWYKK